MIVDKPPWVTHDSLSIFSIDADSTGTRLVTGGSDSKVKVWSMGPLLDAQAEAKEGASRLLATLDQHASPVNVVRFSKSGNFIASGADDNVVMVCELKPGKGQASFGNSDRPNVENWRAVMHFRDHHNNIVDLAWSPGDSMIASCSLDNLVIVYDTSRGSKIVSLARHSSFVKGVSWDPVGRYLASQSDDKSVIIWNVESWEPVRIITDPFVKCVGSTFHLRLDWSPHGLYLIATNAWEEPCHTAVVVDRSKSWDCSYNIVGHKSPVVTVRFNPKLFARGSTGESQGYPVVALGSQDKIITVWLLSLPRPIAVLKHFFESTAVDLSWSADGYTLFACSQDGTLAVFTFTDAELGGKLSDKDAEQTMKNIYGETPSEMGAALPESAAVLLLQDKKGAVKPPAKRAAPSQLQHPTITVPPTQVQPMVHPQANGNSSKPRPTQKETVQNDGRRRIIPESIGPAGAQTPVLGSTPRIGEPSTAPVRKESIPVAPSAAVAPTSTGEKDADVQRVARSPAKRKIAPCLASPQRAQNDGNLPLANSGRPAHAMDNQPALPRPVGQPILTLVIHGEEKATSLFPSAEAPLHVDVKSGASGTEITCSKSSQTLWKDRFKSSVVAMAGNRRLVSIALEDGSLFFYTQAGRRLLPPIAVRGGVSFLGIRDSNVLVVSYAGLVQVFDMEKLQCTIETSVENLTVGPSQRHVLAVSLTSSGLPVLVLDNNHAYVFENSLRSWMRVADNDFGGSVFNTTMSIPSGEEGNELALLQMRASTIAGGSAFLSSIMSGGYGLQKEKEESQITRRHLETLIGAAQVLNSPLEYKRWVTAYAEYLATEGDERTLRELCVSLLGPPRPLSPAEKSASESAGLQLQDGLGPWKPTVLGLDKRALLRDEVMKAIAQGGNTQRLLAELLELLQEAEHQS